MSRIVSVEPIPIKIPVEDREGYPTLPGSDYHRRSHRGLVYSKHRETLFIKLTTDEGIVGWGETLASVAPEIGAQIIRSLIAPQLIGQDPLAVDYLWNEMYRSMRDRGHFTGFFADAL